MGWGFLEWVRGRPQRAAPSVVSLRANPSDCKLAETIHLLLDKERAYDAYEALDKHKERAKPLLEAALCADARFRDMAGSVQGWGRPLFDVVLTILFEWRSEYAIGETLKLVDNSDSALRAIAARLLALTGEARFVPMLVHLSRDPDAEVRDAVGHGLSDLLEYSHRGRHLDDAVGLALYDFMRGCALRTDKGPGCDFAEALFRCAPRRAQADLADPAVLTIDRTWLYDLLKTFRKREIRLPHARIIELLRDAMAILDRDDFVYRDHCLIGSTVEELLRALAGHDRAEADRWIQRLRSHAQEAAREAAQEARERLSGDPVSVSLAAFEAAGDLAAMRPEHRVVYLVWLLDAEICNGGWLQWAANSSGAYANQTLEALREIGAESAEKELRVLLNVMGPRFATPSQAARKKAIDRALRDGRPFPDDGVMWKLSPELRAKIYDYAARHPDAFQDGRPR